MPHARGDVVFSCGGIGATPDDHTRQCARGAGRAAGAAPAGRPSDLIASACATWRAEQGALRARPGRQRAPPQHGRIPRGRAIIPNPYNKIAGFSVRAARGRRILRAGLPGDGLADDRVGARRPLLRRGAPCRRRARASVVVFGSMEATLTPLMEDIEARFAGIKVFSLPSVDHPQWGRHIELGVKGEAAALDTAYADARRPAPPGLELGPEPWCAERRNAHHLGIETHQDGAQRRRLPALLPLPRCSGAFQIPRVRFLTTPTHQPPQAPPGDLLMAKTVADVMKMVKDNEVKFVDFRFTDTRGKEQHVRACVPLSTKTSSPPATPSTVRRSPAGRASRRRTCC